MNQISRTNKTNPSKTSGLTNSFSRTSAKNNNGLGQKKDLSRSVLSIGNILDVNITALGPKNQGITEFSNGITIVTSDLPNANLEDKIRIQIVQMNHTKPLFAMAKLEEVLKKSQKEAPVKVGEILDISEGELKVRSFSKGSSILEQSSKMKRGTSYVELTNGYRILIPSFLSQESLSLNDKIKSGKYPKIEITRVKSTYAVAKVFSNMPKPRAQKSKFSDSKNLSFFSTLSKTDLNPTKNEKKPSLQNLKNKAVFKNQSLGLKMDPVSKAFHARVGNVAKGKLPFFPQSSLFYLRSKEMGPKLTVGTQLQVYLPLNSKKKVSKILVSTSGEYLVTKLNGLILFLKLSLGVKFHTSGNVPTKVQIQITKIENHFIVAKVIQLAPLSRAKKQLKAKHTVLTMLRSGMHFGEKAIKSHANMKKFIWLRKKGSNLNRPLIKKGRYLINLLKTRRCLIYSLKQLAKYAAKGRTFLFVGTKKPAAGLIARAALLTKNAFFVNTRWLGGMLTNWKTILKSISKIKPILKEKQKMIQTILEKRQDIKKSLIQKVNKLRKTSRQLIQKGQFLITQVKNEKLKLVETSQILLRKKTEFLQKNQLLLQKYHQLNDKKKKLQEKALQFQEKGNVILVQKKALIAQLVSYQKKLRELNLLLSLGQEVRTFKREIVSQGKELLSISYDQFSKFNENLQEMESLKQVLVPNPPKLLLNKMIRLIRQRSNSGLMTSLSVNLPKQSEKGILVSKLLTKFSRFIPFIKTYKEILILRIQNTQTLLINLQKYLPKFQSKALGFLQLKKQVDAELSLVKNQLFSAKEVIKLMKRKLKKLASEQRLLDFLPKLRYLPTQKSKMAEAIQIIMKKFVDPKMRYPLDKIYDEKLKFQSKKIAATRKKKWQRLEKYFGGVTKMAKMKRKQISQNVAIIVGQKEEMNAVYECKKLGIKMFHIVDTNCNPRLADYLVPANDDSRNSIKLILGQILTYLKLAQKLRKKMAKKSFSTQRNFSIVK